MNVERYGFMVDQVSQLQFLVNRNAGQSGCSAITLVKLSGPTDPFHCNALLRAKTVGPRTIKH